MKAFKLALGAFRSWLWWLSEYPEGEPFYCELLEMRMLCSFCPNHVRHRVEIDGVKGIEEYCKIAKSKREKLNS